MSFTIQHNGETIKAPRINGRGQGTRHSPGVSLSTKKMDWRAAYWYTVAAWLLFSFTQSMVGAFQAGAILGLHGVVRFMIGIGVSAAEGILVAWCMCPSRGLVTKKQESILRKGSYLVVFLQLCEIMCTYGQKIYPEEKLLLLGMIGFAASMALSAIVTAHLVIHHEEDRIVNMEDADSRIETRIADARITTMEARHRLESKKSLIDVEGEVLKREKMRTLNALNTKESKDGIQQIGEGRAAAVIAAYKERVNNYSIQLLNEAGPKNAAVNPRSLPGAQNGKAKK